MSQLSISMQMPSRELEKSAIDQAVTTLAASVAKEARLHALPLGPALDLTFLLSTHEDAPAFQGMRMGGYTDADGILYFEIAVPATMAGSAQAPRYVAAVLQDAIDNAADFFREQGAGFDAARWHRAILPMLSPLEHPPATH